MELTECTSYGVEIPNTEGRAGMIAIVHPNHTLDLKKLYLGVMDKLPGYARPFFVRVPKQLDLTGNVVRKCYIIKKY